MKITIEPENESEKLEKQVLTGVQQYAICGLRFIDEVNIAPFHSWSGQFDLLISRVYRLLKRMEKEEDKQQ